MRKKKENIRLTSQQRRGANDIDEALATEREERYEEFTGESATDDVGNRYTTDGEFERSVEGIEGPLSNDSITPPYEETPVPETNRVRRRHQAAKRLPRGRHAAARSSKKL